MDLFVQSAYVQTFDLEHLNLGFVESDSFPTEPAQNLTIHMKNVKRFEIEVVLDDETAFDAELWTNNRLVMIQFDQLEAIIIRGREWIRDKLFAIITRNAGLQSVEIELLLEYEEIVLLVNQLAKLTDLTLQDSSSSTVDDVRRLLNGAKLNRICVLANEVLFDKYTDLAKEVEDKWTFAKGDNYEDSIYVIFKRIM